MHPLLSYGLYWHNFLHYDTIMHLMQNEFKVRVNDNVKKIVGTNRNGFNVKWNHASSSSRADKGRRKFVNKVKWYWHTKHSMISHALFETGKDVWMDGWLFSSCINLYQKNNSATTVYALMAIWDLSLVISRTRFRKLHPADLMSYIVHQANVKNFVCQGFFAEQDSECK